MIGRQSGLGRGLGALIPPKPQTIDSSASSVASGQDAHHTPYATDAQDRHPNNTSEVRQILVDQVDPNPHQPRTHFDHAQLEDLIESIKEHGVIQPIVVTPAPDGRYELIVGERRLRASKIAGLLTVPAIIRTATDQQKLEIAIIENVQRQDLNPLEEARSYLRLQDEFNLTQEEVGRRVGKSRPQVANIIRLLQLPDAIQNVLVEGKISVSNARTLLSIPTEEDQMALFHAMVQGNFTVRQTEARVPHLHTRKTISVDPNVADAEDQMRRALGAKVIVKRGVRGEGEVRIAFFNDEDLQAIVKKVTRE